MLEEIKYIFNQFDHKGEFETYQELVSGHINDTYLVKTKKKPHFILQRINHHVFKDVPGLVKNKVAVSKHLQAKLKDLPEEIQKRQVLTFVAAKSGAYFYKSETGNYWNLTYFIDESMTFEVVKDKQIAYEGGRLMGEFLNLTSDFDAAKLTEVIPKFHDMSFRYAQFEDALKIASQERLATAKAQIALVEAAKSEMHILQNLKASGAIKIRVTHNDTKISNILFDAQKKGLCVIDTDTVMPGIVHYDFGDAIRTICNTAAEDETNLDKVEFNFDYYKAYTEGFLKEMKPFLSPIELKYLPLAAKTMIFIMALRFLTDYLNDDVYYKTKYPEHNFDRAKNQFKLIESFSKHYDEL